MSKFVSKQGKQLLRNTIQSTNSQNKILEQNLMWKVQEKKDTVSCERRKRTLTDRSLEDDQDNDRQPSSSNYWMKKLIKEEEKLPDRWGHHGYKELYPNEFESENSDSCSDSSSLDKKKEKSKKRKKKLKKEKKSKKAKKHKKHRRK